MCGIVGIAGVMPVNQSIYDALTVLQHRGQDAAGIITIDANNCFRLRKANGLVSDVFEARHMQRLQGNMGIGHVRYPTAGSSSASEAQPFYVNSPYGITLAHNGNLTNAHELRKKQFEEKGYSLTPGAYVGVAEAQDDGVDFTARMKEIHAELNILQNESNSLMEQINANLKELGLGE